MPDEFTCEHESLPIIDLHVEPEEAIPPPAIEAISDAGPIGNPDGTTFQESLDALLGADAKGSNRVAAARQLRRAIELLVKAVPLPEDARLEIPDYYT